jgi:hypothetical protein
MNKLKTGLVSQNENNSEYNKIYENKLLLLYDENNFEKKYFDIIGLYSHYETLLRSKEARRLYEAFLKYQASTITYLCKMENFSSNIYRILDILLDLKIIIPYREIKIKKKGGQNPILYGVPNLSPETIARKSLECDIRSRKIFKTVDQMVQRTLHEVKNEEIQYTKIVNLTRKTNNGYDFIDLADLVAKDLQEKHDVKVIKKL